MPQLVEKGDSSTTVCRTFVFEEGYLAQTSKLWIRVTTLPTPACAIPKMARWFGGLGDRSCREATAFGRREIEVGMVKQGFRSTPKGLKREGRFVPPTLAKEVKSSRSCGIMRSKRDIKTSQKVVSAKFGRKFHRTKTCGRITKLTYSPHSKSTQPIMMNLHSASPQPWFFLRRPLPSFFPEFIEACRLSVQEMLCFWCTGQSCLKISVGWVRSRQGVTWISASVMIWPWVYPCLTKGKISIIYLSFLARFPPLFTVRGTRIQHDTTKTYATNHVKSHWMLLECWFLVSFCMTPRQMFEDMLRLLAQLPNSLQRCSVTSRNGLDNVAMEWIASGLVDDAQPLGVAATVL